jgi:hypothetical protein
MLRNLHGDFVRFVPWLPYPRLAVAELQPPTRNPQCATIINLQTLYLSCYGDGKFTSIDFASYGTPTGRCGSFQVGHCHATNSKDIVEKYCLGRNNCTIPVTTPVFGDPCYGTVKHLSVQATCTPEYKKTFWNFTLIDPLMEDFMQATKGHSVIINFSTIPEWMFNTPTPVRYPEDPDEVYWNYEQGTELRDRSMQELADYYLRLLQWYTKGQFIDEDGRLHVSGHQYEIPYWEVLNEVDYEHQMSPEHYTKRYDAIVNAMKVVQPRMKFVGLALADPRNGLSFFRYFLNESNHQKGTPIDFISYHFYASSRWRDNVTDYQYFFPQADSFFNVVAQIQNIRAQLNPTVKTTINEVGVILPNDNAPNPGKIPDIYWNAAGAMYAYIFANLAKYGIEVIGESQLVGYPTQFPSVSMVDWNTGQGNARYWILKLLLEHFGPGDSLIKTSSSNERVVFAQGYNTKTGARKILLINKTAGPEKVSIPNIAGGRMSFVDLTTNYNPPPTMTLQTNAVWLNAFAVAIITMST